MNTLSILTKKLAAAATAVEVGVALASPSIDELVAAYEVAADALFDAKIAAGQTAVGFVTI